MKLLFVINIFSCILHNYNLFLTQICLYLRQIKKSGNFFATIFPIKTYEFLGWIFEGENAGREGGNGDIMGF